MSANLGTRSISGTSPQNASVEDPYAQLMTTALDMMRTFNEIISTIDTHSDQYFIDNKVTSDQADH